MYMRFLLFLIILSLSLAGCQSFSPQNAPAGSHTTSTAELKQAQKHLQKLAAFNRWEAKGKIKITVDGEPQSASFEWQQYKNNYTINFFGPFGYGNSWLRRTSKGVTLETPELPTQHAKTPEQLLLQTVGWQAPISNLQYWIKGQPAPKVMRDKQPLTHLTQHGALNALSQQGWDIQFSRHQLYQGLWLPGKITAKRQGVAILVIVKQWSSL